MFFIAKTTCGPPLPEGVSDTARDFMEKCFLVDHRKRPTATQASLLVFRRRPDSGKIGVRFELERRGSCFMLAPVAQLLYAPGHL